MDFAIAKTIRSLIADLTNFEVDNIPSILRNLATLSQQSIDIFRLFHLPIKVGSSSVEVEEIDLVSLSDSDLAEKISESLPQEPSAAGATLPLPPFVWPLIAKLVERLLEKITNR